MSARRRGALHVRGNSIHAVRTAIYNMVPVIVVTLSFKRSELLHWQRVVKVSHLFA